jgi:hypothetical protein
MNLGSLWYMGVVAVGLSRLSGAGFLKSAVWCYGIWAAMIGMFLGAIGLLSMLGGRH